jgi:trimeric autotransporter adhesin
MTSADPETGSAALPCAPQPAVAGPQIGTRLSDFAADHRQRLQQLFTNMKQSEKINGTIDMQEMDPALRQVCSSPLLVHDLEQWYTKEGGPAAAATSTVITELNEREYGYYALTAEGGSRANEAVQKLAAAAKASSGGRKGLEQQQAVASLNLLLIRTLKDESTVATTLTSLVSRSSLQSGSEETMRFLAPVAALDSFLQTKGSRSVQLAPGLRACVQREANPYDEVSIKVSDVPPEISSSVLLSVLLSALRAQASAPGSQQPTMKTVDPAAATEASLMSMLCELGATCAPKLQCNTVSHCRVRRSVTVLMRHDTAVRLPSSLVLPAGLASSDAGRLFLSGGPINACCRNCYRGGHASHACTAGQPQPRNSTITQAWGSGAARYNRQSEQPRRQVQRILKRSASAAVRETATGNHGCHTRRQAAAVEREAVTTAGGTAAVRAATTTAAVSTASTTAASAIAVESTAAPTVAEAPVAAAAQPPVAAAVEAPVAAAAEASTGAADVSAIQFGTFQCTATPTAVTDTPTAVTDTPTEAGAARTVATLDSTRPATAGATAGAPVDASAVPAGSAGTAAPTAGEQIGAPVAAPPVGTATPPPVKRPRAPDSADQLTPQGTTVSSSSGSPRDHQRKARAVVSSPGDTPARRGPAKASAAVAVVTAAAISVSNPYAALATADADDDDASSEAATGGQCTLGVLSSAGSDPRPPSPSL